MLSRVVGGIFFDGQTRQRRKAHRAQDRAMFRVVKSIREVGERALRCEPQRRFRYVFNAAVRFQEHSPEQDSCYKLRDRWISGPLAPPASHIFLEHLENAPLNARFPRQFGASRMRTEPGEWRS